MRERFKNILVVAGSGRNCGKTTFLCSLLKNFKRQKISTIKITPHFHEPTEGLAVLDDNPNYKVFKEENYNSGKDTSRYLQAGAADSFFIQVKDKYLSEAFYSCLQFMKKDQAVVVESATLASYIQPALFLFIQKVDEQLKSSAEDVLSYADEIIFSDGVSFSLLPEQIIFEETWRIKN